MGCITVNNIFTSKKTYICLTESLRTVGDDGDEFMIFVLNTQVV